MTDHSIQGKTVIIAGGATNLGGLIRRDLAAHGAGAVAIHYNSAASKPDVDATVAAGKAPGAEAVAFQANLTAAGAVENSSATRLQPLAIRISRSTPSARCSRSQVPRLPKPNTTR